MSNPGHAMRLRGSARTSVGQVRENNEDHIHLRTGDGFMLALVADGMGGAAAGEEASRIAVEIIDVDLVPADQPDSQQQMSTMPEDMLKFRLRHAIQKANLSIMRRAIEDPEMRGMGTTVTLALLRGSSVLVAHVGDSRAYQISASEHAIEQITSDHSFVEALLAAGHITPEQAEEHPMRNVLYRALGQTEDMDVDMYHARLRHGDWLVLCSDGLTRHVKAYEIARIVLNSHSPEDATAQLIDLANARGGEDNVSVIVIQAEGDPPPSAACLDAHYLPDDPDSDSADTIRMPDLFDTPAPTPGQPEENHQTPAADITDPTLRHKMAAERLSDTETDPTDSDLVFLSGADTQDRAIAQRPAELNGLSRKAAQRAPAPPRPDAGDEEGQDTRTPDQ